MQEKDPETQHEPSLLLSLFFSRPELDTQKTG
jgi:hypothetical protein